MKQAHSLLPRSAGSRSPERRRQGVDAAYKDSSRPRFACGVLIKFDYRHGLGCTADWWRSKCAGEAGRSRRPGSGDCISAATPSTLNPAAPQKETAGKETQQEIQWMQVA
ncbi:MAG: hypothetical protein LW816_21440 [Planctomyces sp.]|nr:hypothetical protein [Planctomyces sp.]